MRVCVLKEIHYSHVQDVAVVQILTNNYFPIERQGTVKCMKLDVSEAPVWCRSPRES